MRNDLLNRLETLCNIASPSGFTTEAIEFVENELENLGLQCHKTRKGALFATLVGKDTVAKKIIAAHVDTLGAMVKEIKSNGKIALTNIGGYSMNSIEGETVKIFANSGEIYTGTIHFEKPSVHIHEEAKNGERKLANMEILLDEITTTKETTESLGIEVGDFVSFDPRFTVTEKGFVKSRHLDDKAGVSCIVQAVKELVEEGVEIQESIIFLFTNYEEVGHGASYDVGDSVEELLCVDMGAPGIGQNGDEFTVTIAVKDGNGPYDYSMRERLCNLSKENDIQYKKDVFVYYGSDAKTMLAAGNDLRFGLIGPGIYASHSYERTHKESLENTVKLIKAYICEK